MQAMTAQTPSAGQLTTTNFGTSYIIQQLQSNPQVTRQEMALYALAAVGLVSELLESVCCRELLTDISVTLKTPLPSPVSLLPSG